MTDGGSSLTRINGAAVGRFDRIEMLSLNEAGSVGAPPAEEHCAAATMRNVDQTTPVLAGTVGSTDASTPNPLPASIAVATDGMAVAAAVNGAIGSFTWNNGWTEGTDQRLSSSNNSLADHSVTATGTDTPSATHTNQNKHAIVVASLSVAQ